jgi:anaerobic selenocysteine-containing dehydrogenase
MRAMRRLTITVLTTAVFLALTAPVALAQSSGHGLIEESDKKITNAGFIIIAGIAVLVSVLSAIQWGLDRRKESKKIKIKVAGGDDRWAGGW